MTTDPQLPDWAQPSTQSSPKRRRGAWPWLIALVIVLVLAVAAWFVGEWIARDVVTKTIRQGIITSLALPADQQVDVEIDGAVIPQLISGTFADVTVTSDDVTVGPLSGDFTVRAQGISIRDAAHADTASATVSLDTAQLRGLLSTVDGFPSDTVGIAEPNVTISTALSFLGVDFPIGVALAPSAADGDLVLTPAALQLGGADITAASLRDRFGRFADPVLRDWDVCIAQYLPKGVHLKTVAVHGKRLEANLDIDGGIVTDPTLQAKGTCA